MNDFKFTARIGYIKFFPAKENKDAMIALSCFTTGPANLGGNTPITLRVYGAWAEACNTYCKVGTVIAAGGFYGIDKRGDNIYPYVRATRMVEFLHNTKTDLERIELPSPECFSSLPEAQTFVASVVEHFGFRVSPAEKFLLLLTRIAESGKAAEMAEIYSWLERVSEIFD